MEFIPYCYLQISLLKKAFCLLFFVFRLILFVIVIQTVNDELKKVFRHVAFLRILCPFAFFLLFFHVLCFQVTHLVSCLCNDFGVVQGFMLKIFVFLFHPLLFSIFVPILRLIQNLGSHRLSCCLRSSVEFYCLIIFFHYHHHQ